MRSKADTDNARQREIAVRRQTSEGGDALALREEYPPEEFAGFGNFGESPEWHPGQARPGEEPEGE